MAKRKLNKKALYEKAIELIASDSDIIYIEDVISLLSVSKETFYRYYPIEGKEYSAIRQMLDNNRRKNTLGQRKEWRVSDESTLRIAYYKLNATDDEREALGVKTSAKVKDMNEFELEIP